MIEFKERIPVVIKDTGDKATALYCIVSPNSENDHWVVFLTDGTIIKLNTNQILVEFN